MFEGVFTSFDLLDCLVPCPLLGSSLRSASGFLSLKILSFALFYSELLPSHTCPPWDYFSYYLASTMARRYTASEKAKWTCKSTSPVRRAPIPIPRTDNSALIEQNKLTLIGRVTNPSTQNTRALVDFFLQHWLVAGSITGRELGPHLFQFSFESERDLQSILNKAPYHFKRWMLMLQRWEPSVSENFPSIISFWIRVHGLPLHFWTDEALEAIGSGLGHVDLKDATKGRLRVSINGLLPLERYLEVSLPSGDILKVELEYEGLHKHCFFCSISLPRAR